jgi:hypothetical protein
LIFVISHFHIITKVKIAHYSFKWTDLHCLLSLALKNSYSNRALKQKTSQLSCKTISNHLNSGLSSSKVCLGSPYFLLIALFSRIIWELYTHKHFSIFRWIDYMAQSNKLASPVWGMQYTLHWMSLIHSHRNMWSTPWRWYVVIIFTFWVLTSVSVVILLACLTFFLALLQLVDG